MAIAFDSGGSAAVTANSTSFTVNITAAAVGADCYAWKAINVLNASISIPGWTTIAVVPTASTMTVGLFYRRKVSGDTTFVGTTTSGKGVHAWASYTGLDATTPHETASASNLLAKNASSVNVATPSVTEAGGNSWAVAFFASRTSTSGNKVITWTPPAGTTERFDVNNSAATSGPWVGVEIVDSAALVTAGARSYTSVASFAEQYGVGALLYLNEAAAAGTNQPLTGAVAASSSTSATIAARVALAGVVAAASAVTGGLTANHPASGTNAATTTTAGALAADHLLTGSTAATASTTGTPGAQQSLAGTVAASATTTGTLALRTPLTGTVAAATTTTGTLTSRQTLTGTTAATSTTAGTFFEAGPQNYPLAGTVAATTSTTGAVTARHPLGGTVAAVSSAAGAVARAAALAGAVESIAVTFGDITATLVLSGTVDAVGATAGEFVPPVTQFQGRILSASLAIPTALGSIAVPSATGDLVTHRVSARLSILRARGVIT